MHRRQAKIASHEAETVRQEGARGSGSWFRTKAPASHLNTERKSSRGSTDSIGAGAFPITVSA
jgi:hypothetical protein